MFFFVQQYSRKWDAFTFIHIQVLHVGACIGGIVVLFRKFIETEQHHSSY